MPQAAMDLGWPGLGRGLDLSCKDDPVLRLSLNGVMVALIGTYSSRTTEAAQLLPDFLIETKWGFEPRSGFSEATTLNS